MTNGDLRLRVGIDGFNLALSRGTGIATYTRVLSRCLTDLGHAVDVLYGVPMARRESDLMREIMFFDRLGSDRTRKAPGLFTARWRHELALRFRGADAVTVPITGRVISQGFRGRMPSFDRILNIPDLFPVAIRYFRRHGHFLPIRVPDGPQIMHWTYPLPIHLEGARNIYTVHDLVPLRLPYTTLDDKGFHIGLLRGCLRYGDHICTVSEASLRDIVELFPDAAGRVTNTYQSIDLPTSATQADEAQVAAQLEGVFGLRRGGYFLFFGSLEPKKNVGRLVEAYLSSGITTPLVLVGAQTWKSEHELRWVTAHQDAAERSGGKARIIQHEYVPFETLLTLIRGARAVTFPSLYEGFGLPVLEAMMLGTPVLTASTASLPEIAGEAALLVDPYDVGAIAAGLRRLDGDEALRRRLSGQGRVQAGKFSMAAYGERVSAMYRRILPAASG